MSQLIVKNLMSTNSKPLGSQLSIAVSLAFDVIATDFPEVNIEVRGFNKSWATAPGFYSDDSKGMIKLVNTSIVMLDDIEPEHPLYVPFMDCILRATHTLIRQRNLDEYNTSSVAGIGSFSEQLAKFIGMVNPPPRAFKPTPPPPTPLAQPTPPPPPQPPVFGQGTSVPSKNNSYAKAAAARPAKQQSPPRPQAPAAPAAVAIAPASKPSGRKRRARHTCHGALHRGVQLTPPAGFSIRASHISPAMLAEINKHLQDDVNSDVILEHSEDSGSGIFIPS
ncbi:hypothetical protein Agabi119p4_3845 [Agaricus bisporus var. burnettii]|uniref:Uncharacterized protein n=1 Tax=Agaricus bisporus var. burnettii TaxID=192524 RepID=A0A8H7KIC8_AGABI|nr:hypothetical protein Agabi119p4_3845 [Agaricus bisporus var. burnettii]